MKKQKVWVAFLLVLLFFVVFLGCTILRKNGWWYSSAETSGASSNASELGVVNNSSKELISVNTTFYNYRYDREIYDKVRDQGAQSCYDGTSTKLIGMPYETFNNKLHKYYEKNSVKVGIYTGNFYNYYGGLEGVGGNKVDFPTYHNYKWAPNIANRNSPYNSVCQGIVKDTLGGSNQDTLMMKTTNGEIEVPYFSRSFLEQKKNNVAIGAIKENVKFPFRKVTSGTKKGYYEFDSTIDVIRFKDMWNQPQDKPDNDYYYFGSAGKLNYYYKEKFVYSKASDNPQFLPFNHSNTKFTSSESGTSEKQKILDFGFGIRFDIPFYLSENGKVDGKNMVFEFSGDDDVWIFLDGKLVLDLGGQHEAATGTIDFGVDGGAKSTVARITRINNSSSATDSASSDKILKEDTWVEKNKQSDLIPLQKGDTIKHVITVYYMERGMFSSNFHMAFNFVPEGEVKPEAIPEMTPVPEQKDEYGGTLKIQNKVAFPTTTPDADKKSKDKINAVFFETVKELGEDDVFQYSIANKGTDKDKVGDSGIRNPSGQLTVRKNGAFGKEKKSYLSFGAVPKVRIYFDIGAIKTLINSLGEANGIKYSEFEFSYDESGNIKGGPQTETIVKSKKGSYVLKKLENSSSIYYADIKVTDTYFYLETEYIIVNSEGGSNTTKIRLRSDQITIIDIDKNINYDGYIFTPKKLTLGGHDANSTNKDNMIIENSSTAFEWKKGGSDYPPLNGGMIEYSSDLPYQSAATTAAIFVPSDTTNYHFVSNTAYEIRETYLAPTKNEDSAETQILVNSVTTSGITGTSGEFGLFYDDSAAFRKQFATGSRMKVVQENTLLIPQRYPEEDLSDEMDDQEVKNALTTFITPNPDGGKVRKASDYYYTTVKAESKGVSGGAITTAEIDVTYDGQFYFSNAFGIAEDSEVDITTTFTNTIKIGSLIISKELNGNMDEDSEHSYGFQVIFSDVFGVGTGDVVYNGSYTLVDENGNKIEKTVDDTTNLIVLQPNQKAIISGIPVGTAYEIKEVNSSDGSTIVDGSVVNEIETTYIAETEDEVITSPKYDGTDGTEGVVVDKENRIISGVIPCRVENGLYGTETDEFEEVKVSVNFINQLGALTITKKIAGDVNNSSYYGTDKLYTFTITDQNDTLYSGDYFVYTYTYENGPNMPATVTRIVKNTTNGAIVLKEGQKAEIGGIRLSNGVKYTVSEEVNATDIFFVESIKVNSSIVDTAITVDTDGNSITTDEFDNTHPTFDVVYSNRYSDAYIEIDKYIDKLYYDDKEYAKDKSYQELTGAKQSFVFKVKQYIYELDAIAGNDKYETSFEVSLDIGNATEPLNTSVEKTFHSEKNDYFYKVSKVILVLGNRYYRIEEDTSWSWKYILKGVDFQDSNAKSQKNGNVVILKSYLDDKNGIVQGKVVPIAEFYNVLDLNKEEIEGDTDSIPNKIKKE